MYTGAVCTLGQCAHRGSEYTGPVCTLGQSVYWGILSSGAGFALEHRGSCVSVYTRAVDMICCLSIFYAGVVCTLEL